MVPLYACHDADCMFREKLHSFSNISVGSVLSKSAVYHTGSSEPVSIMLKDLKCDILSIILCIKFDMPVTYLCTLLLFSCNIIIIIMLF